MDNKPCIGIDLGTTYSCVGFYRNGNVEIITTEHGNRTLPSYVSFTDEERYIGDDAKNMASQNALNTVYDAKRLIGRKYNDQCVQNDIRHFPFKVEPDEDGRPLIEVEYLGETHKFYPEQISAMLLGKMKSMAEKYLGETIEDAVVTVPAYFNDAQRHATKDAGKIAGLNIVRIINEPTAAAIAYGLNKSDEKNILVYDLGGGTLDVSVLTVDNGVFEVKSTSGDTHLGGEDFDLNLREYVILSYAEKKILKTKNLTNNDKEFILDKFRVKTVLELCRRDNLTRDDTYTDGVNEYINNVIKYQQLKKDHKKMRKLLTLCEQAKKTLSVNNTATINMDNFYDGDDLSMSITRNKFEELCSECFTRSLEPITKALKDAKFTYDDINDVVLIGGSTRIPKIRQLLNELFPGKLKSDINPDEAVAFGASVQAAILSNGGDSKTDQLVLVDVTPLSLGIETAGGVMNVMIKRNTQIPASVQQVYSTYSDNQPGVTVKVYEGERSLTKDCNCLGTFELTGLPPLPKGIPRIRVTFMVDENGIMSVQAVEETTQKQSKIVIENKKGRLDDDAIDKMIKEAERFSEKDKLIKDRIESKNNLECYIGTVKRTIENVEIKIKLGESKFAELFKLLEAVETWIEESDETNGIQKDDYDNKYREVENIFVPILKAIMQ